MPDEEAEGVDEGDLVIGPDAPVEDEVEEGKLNEGDIDDIWKIYKINKI